MTNVEIKVRIWTAQCMRMADDGIVFKIWMDRMDENDYVREWLMRGKS